MFRHFMAALLTGIAVAVADRASATSGQAHHQHGLIGMERGKTHQEVAQHEHPPAALLPECASEDIAARLRAEHVHWGDRAKLDEHAAFLQLVRTCMMTNVAVQSGLWTDPRTWRDGKVPGEGARVVIPETLSVRLDALRDAAALDWVRVDGRLSFAPDADTALALRTLVVTEHGRVTIGSVSDPVRPHVKARLLFAPREARDRKADPFDLGGGLISHGIVEMVGARKTPHRQAETPLRRGTRRIDFAEPVVGWQAGDRLLVPGTDAFNDEDDVATVASVSGDGRSVELERPLAFDHPSRGNLRVPVGNLTRNVELRSIRSAPTGARAHVMVMHVQTGSVFDGVGFFDLGRTDTRRAHTVPEIGPDGETKPGSDSNTIGRYAVHFHVLSGARRHVPPHIVRNSVVVDSPKYGIVNHGAHVLAEDNVTFRIAGSHIVAENGSEIGAFRRNMAVRSAGSSEHILESRMSIYDFGHGGHGLWLQSGGVEVTDNWSAGHAGAGIFSMGMEFREHGRVVHFDARNAEPSPFVDEHGLIRTMDVSFHMARNTVAASAKGLEIWYHKIYPTHRELSVVDGLTVWNVAEEGIAVPYSKHVALRNVRLLGSNRTHYAGIAGNSMTESVTVDGAEVRDFAVGIRVPGRGRNTVRNATLRNPVNIEISLLTHEGRQVQLENIAFEPTDPGSGADVMMRSSKALYGDIGILFEPDRIELTDRHGRNRRLFFPFQHPAAVLFPQDGPGPETVRGLSAEEIHRRFGLAPGGVLAPKDATPLPRSNALAAAPAWPADSEQLDRSTAEASSHRGSWNEPRPFESDPIRLKHFVGAPPSTGSASAAQGWRVLNAAAEANPALVNVNKNPAKFMMRRGLLPLRIHPDDVPYGYRVHGTILEMVDDHLAIRQIEKEFHNLKVESDGFVRIAFTFTNLAEVAIPVEIALEVTDKAVRRGQNIDYYLQREYCGACGNDSFAEDALRFYTTGEIEPIEPIAGACDRLKDTRVVLPKPFLREAGHSYVAMLPQHAAASDNLDAPRRSPFLLCESGTELRDPHSVHDVIRREGRGRHSHWGEALYFSSSDGSDPNTNGKEYALVRRLGR